MKNQLNSVKNQLNSVRNQLNSVRNQLEQGCFETDDEKDHMTVFSTSLRKVSPGEEELK